MGDHCAAVVPWVHLRAQTTYFVGKEVVEMATSAGLVMNLHSSSTNFGNYLFLLHSN